MLRKNKILLGLAVLFVSSAIIMGSHVEANLDLFLDKYEKTRVEVNGSMIQEDDVPAFIVNNRTVIPLRQAAEMLNAIVEWDEGRRVVKITKPIVNMTRIETNRTTKLVNPSFEPKKQHSFEVVTEVSRVPISKNLKARFIVVDSNNKQINLPEATNSFTVDTAQFNGGFKGNLSVIGLTFPSVGEYILKLQIENPDPSDNNFITIGEYVMYVK